MSARQRTGPLLLLVLVLGAAWVLHEFGLIKFPGLNNAEGLRAIILGFGPIDGIITASAER
jgi:hypothetical protein